MFVKIFFRVRIVALDVVFLSIFFSSVLSLCPIASFCARFSDFSVCIFVSLHPSLYLSLLYGQFVLVFYLWSISVGSLLASYRRWNPCFRAIFSNMLKRIKRGINLPNNYIALSWQKKQAMLAITAKKTFRYIEYENMQNLPSLMARVS